MSALAPVAFRFDRITHAYSDEQGVVLPHITGMLETAGLIDSTWYTDDASERGTAVHDLTAAFDLGALDVGSLVGCYRPWVLAHVEAMAMLSPRFHAIEEAEVHPQYRFGGRPDRVCTIFGGRGVLEIKTGAPELSHQVQTALQVILVAWRRRLPPTSYVRLALYLRHTGKYVLQHHRDNRDFDRAYEVIKETCHGGD